MPGHNVVERHISHISLTGEFHRIMDIVAPENVQLSTSFSIQNVPQETYKALIGWANGQWSIEARSSMISCSVEDPIGALHETGRGWAGAVCRPSREAVQNLILRLGWRRAGSDSSGRRSACDGSQDDSDSQKQARL